MKTNICYFFFMNSGITIRQFTKYEWSSLACKQVLFPQEALSAFVLTYWTQSLLFSPHLAGILFYFQNYTFQRICTHAPTSGIIHILQLKSIDSSLIPWQFMENVLVDVAAAAVFLNSGFCRFIILTFLNSVSFSNCFSSLLMPSVQFFGQFYDLLIIFLDVFNCNVLLQCSGNLF